MSVELEDPLERARRRAEDWRIGGPGSGPEDLHPFRGNQWTGGIPGSASFQSGHHASIFHQAKASGIRYVAPPAVALTDQPVPTDGYAVPIEPDRAVDLDPNDISPDYFLSFETDNLDLWLSEEDQAIFQTYMGVFYNPKTGKLTIIPTKLVPTKAQAKVLADKYKQDAFYNISEGEAYDADIAPSDETTNSLPDPAARYGGAASEIRGRHQLGRDEAEARRALDANLDPLDLAVRRAAEWRYAEDQPRVPAGEPGGGRFAGDGAGPALDRSDPLVGPHSPVMLAAIARATADVLSASHEAVPHERVIILDKNGQEVWRKEGNDHTVEGRPSELASVPYGAFQIHNHPGPYMGGFSAADMATAAFLQASESRVVTDKYTYIVRPGKEGWGAHWPTRDWTAGEHKNDGEKVFMRNFNRWVNSQEHAAIMLSFEKGSPERAEYNQRGSDAIARAVAKATGIEYIRVLNPGWAGK